MTESHSESNRQFVSQEVPHYPSLDSEQTPSAVPTLVDPSAVEKEHTTETPTAKANRRLVFTNNSNVISVRVEK